MRSLLKAERDLFTVLCADCKDICLISTELNGIETAAIAHVAIDNDDYFITPLAVLVNDEIFDLLKNPAD